MLPQGIQSCSYHGKSMSSHDKVKAMNQWWPNDSSIQVMVCTSSFGIGNDVTNIDLVTKISCPSSVEELLQTFGRARWEGIANGTLQLVCLRVIFMILDNGVFAYVPVQAFSCVQSQTSNMLPSGVRTDERGKAGNPAAVPGSVAVCVLSYTWQMQEESHPGILWEGATFTRDDYWRVLGCAQTQHQYRIERQRWQKFLQEFRKFLQDMYYTGMLSRWYLMFLLAR